MTREVNSTIFLHLMKTAGMSLNQLLGQFYSDERNCFKNPIYEGSYLNEYSTAANVDKLATDYDYIAGHFCYSSLEEIKTEKTKLNQSVLTITILRDPIDRIISLYNYYLKEFFTDVPYDVKDVHGEYLYKKFAEDHITFEDFIFDNNAILGLTNNYLTRFLSSRTVSSLWDTLVYQDLIDAKTNLYAFDVVGIQEEYDEFCKVVLNKFGKDYSKFQDFYSENVSKVDVDFPKGLHYFSKDQLTEDLYKRMDELTKFDYSLYKHAQKLFSLQKKSFGRKKTKLYLHVGTHKTGTTAIQTFLADNHLKLIEQGIYFAKNNAIVENKDVKLRRAIEEDDLDYVAKSLLDTIDESIKNECHTVILSDEDYSLFGYENSPKLKVLTYLFDVYPIVYLRRQDRYYESYYAFSVQWYYRRYAFSPYEILSKCPRADYLMLLNNLSYCFGKDQLAARIYDHIKNGDVIDDFLQIFNLKKANFSLPKREESNVSPNKYIVEFLFRINHILNMPVEKYQDIKDYLLTKSTISNGPKANFFTHEERRYILSDWEEINKIIARDFFNVKEIFSDDIKIEVGKSLAPSSFLEVLNELHVNSLLDEDQVRTIYNSNKNFVGLLNNTSEPLISVIIPVYNTSNYLNRCLQSIVNQTYRNLEIIIVNDSSTDDSEQIIKNYVSEDKRIKVVTHNENKGLFLTRLSGSDISTGDFISFVDSDDWLAADYYRRLVSKAILEDADIIEANFVMENKNEMYLHSLNRVTEEILEGEQIQKAYFSQQGQAFHWSVIWNKIYRRDLWEKSRTFFDGISSHLIMTEDVAFSSVLFSNTKKYASIEYDGYFYSRNVDASTTMLPNKERFMKQIKDLGITFNFVENYLEITGRTDKYGNDFSEWKKRYFRTWCRNIEDMKFKFTDKNELEKTLMNVLNQSELSYPSKHDGYFYSEVTKWNSAHYNNIIDLIVSDEFEYISFDIFDTLISRPLFTPSDLFLIMDHLIAKKFNDTSLNFTDLRVRAEAEVRSSIGTMYQEINYDEIYKYLRDNFHIPEKIIKFAKKLEVDLELKFCKCRNSTKELFELAKYINKKIIIISDMYLPSDVIKQILYTNGYEGYYKLYLSSEIRLTKHKGDLYQFVSNDLSVKPSSILHIGDNWDSDFANSEKNGFKGVFYPKAVDVFMGKIEGTMTDDQTSIFYNPNHGWADHRHSLDYFGQRSMLAVIANKYFDNPFKQYNPNSDFNLDPYFIGYYALGMNMFGIGLWLNEHFSKHNYKTAHFIARDGFIIKKVFDEINKYTKLDLNTNYLHLSRRALLPLTLTNEHDLFGLYHIMNISNFTPNDILTNFLGYEVSDDIELKFKRKGVLLNKRFESNIEFNLFMNSVIDLELFSNKNEYINKLLEYFDEIISDNDAIFDIGYNGTTQKILVELLKKRIDGYYVHLNTDKSLRADKVYNSKVFSFLDYTPTIKGSIREYLFSEIAPSCVRFEVSNNEVSLVFEEDNFNFFDKFVLEKVHKGALDFVEDYLKIFNEYIDMITYRNYEISLPLECLLHKPKEEDKKAFEFSTFNDVISGDYNVSMTLLDIWNLELNRVDLLDNGSKPVTPNIHSSGNLLEGKSVWQKALFYLFFDFKEFKEKTKNKIKLYI